MSRTGIIDTHAHLDDNRFDSDRDQLIEKLGPELDAVINQGCTLASSAASIALAEKYPFIYAAVGIHPEDLATVKDDSYLDQLAAWAAHPKVVAIGEIGLDYYWKENEPREVQLKRLRQQVDLARQVRLLKELRRLAGEGRIVVAVLHDLALAAQWADRIVMLHAGRTHAEGRPDQVLTPDLLAQVYGVEARVERCSQGRIMVLIDGEHAPG